MPSIRMHTNHSTRELLNKKPLMAITGTKAASHSDGRRPRRWVMAEANGVMANTPSQPVATNTPASAVDTPSPLSRRSSSGMSMK